MNTKERRRLLNSIMKEVMDLGLSSYYTIFLSNLILEKIENPTIGVDKLMVKVNQIMPKEYNGPVMQVSKEKNMQNLEEVLHDCDKINQISKEGAGLVSGFIVKNTVNYFVQKVIEQY